jgi:hypothetical protein
VQYRGLADSIVNYGVAQHQATDLASFESAATKHMESLSDELSRTGQLAATALPSMLA